MVAKTRELTISSGQLLTTTPKNSAGFSRNGEPCPLAGSIDACVSLKPSGHYRPGIFYPMRYITGRYSRCSLTGGGDGEACCKFLGLACYLPVRHGYMQAVSDISVPKHSELALAATGLLALVIGCLVYLFDRVPESVYLLGAAFPHWQDGQNVFGFIGNHLPSFTHVFGFILLTSAILAGGRKTTLIISMAWCGIDMLFEGGQHPDAAAWLAPRVPDWFKPIPFLENTGPYFTQGTFDVLDLLAITLGTVAAYLMIRWLSVKEHPS